MFSAVISRSRLAFRKSVSKRLLSRDSLLTKGATKRHHHDDENPFAKRLSFEERLEWSSLNKFDYTSVKAYKKQVQRHQDQEDERGLKMAEQKFHFYCGYHFPTAVFTFNLGKKSKVHEMQNKRQEKKKKSKRGKKQRKKGYFFNVPEMTLYNYLNSIGIIPPCNSLFITKLAWENVSGLSGLISDAILPIISTKSALPDGQVVIYGPKGVGAYVRRLLTCQFSGKACESLWPNLVFTDVHDGDIINDGFLKVRVHELKPTLKGQSTLLYQVEQVNDNQSEELLPEEFHDDISNEKSQNVPIAHRAVIVDCPTVSHADALLKQNLLFDEENSRTTIVHQTPSQIFNKSVYQTWLRKTASCQHISSTEDAKYRMTPRKSMIRAACNNVSSTFFPLHGQAHFLDDYKMSVGRTTGYVNDEKYRRWRITQKCDEKGIDWKSLSHGICGKLTNTAENLLSCIENLDEKPQAESSNLTYPRMTVLGSGSSKMSTRNQSGYLLQTCANKYLLIDCSAGTLEQIYSHFGQVSDVLSKIKVIFVSHKHTDHTCGLGFLLKKIMEIRVQKNEVHEKVIILAPSTVFKFIDAIFEREVLSKHFDFQVPWSKHDTKLRNSRTLVQNKLGLDWFTTIRVDHGPVTFGFALECNGWKMAFSSDTLPMSKFLISLGKNADLLVHESTYGSSYEFVKAHHKMHSFKDGAIATAKAMGAKNLLLTHFDSMLPLLPVPEPYSNDVSYKGNVFYAMDHLEFSFSEMHLLPSLHDRFQHVFQHSCKKYEKKMLKLRASKECVNKRLLETYSKVIESKNQS